MTAVMSGVSAGMSAYLFAHPDVNAFFSGLQGLPKDQVGAQTQIYLDADLEMKSKLLDKMTPPESKPGRYRPDDTLLAFLKSL